MRISKLRGLSRQVLSFQVAGSVAVVSLLPNPPFPTTILYPNLILNSTVRNIKSYTAGVPDISSGNPHSETT